MDVCLYFVGSLFLVLQINIITAQVVFRQNKYEALEPGSNVTGSSIAVHEKTSTIFCSIWCVLNIQCELFKQRGTRQGSCILISRNGGDTFVSVEHNLIYNIVLPARSWPDGTEPAVYFRFDTLRNVQLKQGPQDAHFSALVSGRVNKAIKLDHTQKQWIDLGLLSEACMSQPHTCGPEGAAVSFWVKLVGWPDWGGIISSRDSQSGGGFNIFCVTVIRTEVQVSDGKFQGSGAKPSGWTHMVLNYLGPDDGTKLYYNGLYHRNNIPKFRDPVIPGNGRTVVGRRQVNSDYHYASLEIDELAMFNTALSEVQIWELFNNL